MLVFPSIVQHLLGPSDANSTHDADDLEKNGKKMHTTRKVLRKSHARSTGLDLNPIDKGLHDFAEDAPKGDPTRTYRILPIFSGIMIPFSIMLSIPSLTGHWYVRTGEDNQLLEVKSNPLLLDVGMGFSMGCGVLANMCLVIRFSERRIKLMTILCIMFLSLHDLINIPSVIIFGVIHRFDDGFTYGQSFWLTTSSTIFSTATNITLIYDYARTTDFTHSGSGLTAKQRSLVIIVIVLLCYVSFGSLLLAVMLDTTFIDALYLCVVSIETIGFGDLHPTTTATRIVICLYIAGGILNLALAVALSRDALLEAAAASFDARLKAARVRQRERHIRTRWRAAVRWHLRALGKPMWINDRDEERKQRVGHGRRHHWYSAVRRVWRRVSDEVWREWEDPAWKYVYGPNHTRLNLEVLSQAQLETAALEAGAPLSELLPQGLRLRWAEDSSNSGLPVSQPVGEAGHGQHPPSLTHMRVGGMVSLLGKFALAITFGQEESEHREEDGDDTAAEESLRPHGVPLTKSLTMTTMTVYDDDGGPPESLESVERNAFYARLGVALSLFVVFWMAGSAIFMTTESWSFGSAVYFCFISFTTVGYGDFAPKTPAGRSIFVVWALLGVGTMTILISILAEAYSSRYKSVIRSEVYQATTAVFQTGTANRPQFFDSPATSHSSNPGTEESSLSPVTILSAMASYVGATRTQCTLRPGRNRASSNALFPIPEPRNANDSDLTCEPSGTAVDSLPQDVLRHAEHLIALLDARSQRGGEPTVLATDFAEGSKLQGRAELDEPDMEILLYEIEKSLRQIAVAAKQALDVNDP